MKYTLYITRKLILVRIYNSLVEALGNMEDDMNRCLLKNNKGHGTYPYILKDSDGRIHINNTFSLNLR